MNAVALQIPGHEHEEIVLARDQPEYVPLPALPIVLETTMLRDGSEQIGRVADVLTRWRPTDEERAALANGADIWLETMTFGEPLQPIRLSVECPIETEAQS